MGRTSGNYLEQLGGMLLPPRCVLCGGRGQPPSLDLCAGCQQALPSVHPPLVVSSAPLHWLFAAFAYAHPVDHLVHALKYRGQLAVGRVLGTLLAKQVVAAGIACDVDVVVPVSLHPARLAERTFNQSAEIARWAARGLELRLDAAQVVRVRATVPQVGLPRDDRVRNLSGAFRAAPTVRGLHVAVVDDVVTTGSTLRAVGEALLEAGARAVDGWCVCRAEAAEGLDLRDGQEDRRR